MRVAIGLLLLGLAVGCAGSNAEVRTAKSAIYTAKIDHVLDQAIQAAQEKYVIDGVEATNHRFKTQMQGYNAEGGRQSAGKDSFVNMSQGSIMLFFVVEAKYVGEGSPGDERVAVVITPKTYQKLDFSPKPRELAPDDPNLPGWVKGRVDALAIAVYTRLKDHAVTQGAEAPATTPTAPTAPAPAPAPAPGEPAEPAQPASVTP